MVDVIGGHADDTPILAEKIAEALYYRLAADAAACVTLVYGAPAAAGENVLVGRSLIPLDLTRFPPPRDLLPPLVNPSPRLLVANLAEEYVFAELCEAAALSLAAETIARMQAMMMARNNVRRMLDQLTGRYHLLRQEQITKELLEIFSFVAAASTTWPMAKKSTIVRDYEVGDKELFVQTVSQASFPHSQTRSFYSARAGICSSSSPLRSTLLSISALAPTRRSAIMLARDIMSKEVEWVKKSATVRDVARLLLKKSISAVPVLDEDGRPIGMVSEGDIAAESELRRNERAQWWLAQLAEGEPMDPKFLATIQLSNRDVGGIMRSPVISVGEDAEVEEIAQLMEKKKIKRVIILRAEKMVGIVTRADIVRAVAAKCEIKAQVTEQGRVLASD